MLVVAAAIIDSGSLLACRRIKPEPVAGLFELPGGKVHDGEEAVAALVREVREELAVEIDCWATPIGSWPLNADTSLEVYRASLVGDRPTQSTDHDQLVWLDTSQWLSGVEWIPADRLAISRLLEDEAERQQGRVHEH